MIAVHHPAECSLIECLQKLMNLNFSLRLRRADFFPPTLGSVTFIMICSAKIKSLEVIQNAFLWWLMKTMSHVEASPADKLPKAGAGSDENFFHFVFTLRLPNYSLWPNPWNWRERKENEHRIFMTPKGLCHRSTICEDSKSEASQRESLCSSYCF